MMELLPVVKLCFNFLLYLRLVSSSLTIHNEHYSILERFLVQFVEKHDPRHLLVVGGSANDVRHAQPLFNRYPYAVCTDLQTCDYPKSFNRGSFAILFLDDLNKETMKESTRILTGVGNESKCLFVLKGPLQDDDIQLVFEGLMEGVSALCELVHFDKEVIRHRRSFYGRNCSLGIESRSVWRPGSNLDTIESWASEIRDFNGCPVRVSTVKSLPKMVIEDNPDGSLSIVGGQEGNLVLAIAEKLNFTLSLDSSTVIDQRRYTSLSGVVDAITSQVAEFGISSFRPTTDLMKIIEFSESYTQTCVTWGVSLKPSGADDLLFNEYSWKVWALIGVMFIISSVIQHLSRNGNQRGVGFVAVVLDIFSVNLGNPIIHVSGSIGGRLIFMSCVFYSMVITTGYKTSLASILTTGDASPIATDVAGILRANISVGGSRYNLGVMKDLYTENDYRSALVRRYVVLDSLPEVIDRLKDARGFAFFTRFSTLHYMQDVIAREQGLIVFDVLYPCASTYHSVIGFQKGSPLLQPVNEIIVRLRESGILYYWDPISNAKNDEALKRNNVNRWSAQLMQQKFKNLFIFYGCCITVCLLAFFTELLIARFCSKTRLLLA